MSDHWLRCGSLVTGHGETPENDMAVRVARGMIAEVRPWADGHGIDGHVTDLSDSTLAPGFVDAHTHLVFGNGMDHASTRQAVEDMSTGELSDVAAEHAVECLLGGVTTIRDCGDRDFVSVRLRDEVSAGLRPGPRIVAAGPPMTIAGGHLHWCGGAVGSSVDIPAAVDRLCRHGVDVVKVMASGGNMTDGSAPWRPQFTVDELRRIVALAHEQGRAVAAHAHSTDAIRYAVRAGVDTIEHCTWRSAEGTLQVDPDVVAEIVQRDIHVVLTMAGIHRGLLPDESDVSDVQREAALGSSDTGDLRADHGWARSMRLQGVRMALASDAGVRLTSFRRFDQTIRCGMVALDLTASQAIGLATLEAARALRVDDTVGSIDVGKVADFVTLEGFVNNSTEQIGPIRQVWQSGRVVVHGGEPTSRDDASIRLDQSLRP